MCHIPHTHTSPCCCSCCFNTSSLLCSQLLVAFMICRAEFAVVLMPITTSVIVSLQGNQLAKAERCVLLLMLFLLHRLACVACFPLATSPPSAPQAPLGFNGPLLASVGRAFALAPEVMAFVLFLDFANHAATPNADFRVRPTLDESSSSSSSETSSSSSNGRVMELVAVANIAAGEEVLVNYSGPQGFTNQWFMAKYGFVPEGGNMADRLTGLTVPEG